MVLGAPGKVVKQLAPEVIAKMREGAPASPSGLSTKLRPPAAPRARLGPTARAGGAQVRTSMCRTPRASRQS